MRLAATASAAFAVCLAVAIPAPAQDKEERPDIGGSMIEGLKKTEGCLGVDSGQWQSGKQTIIAWFEDKAAVKRWYYSQPHQRVMATFAEQSGEKPLAHVPDGTGPIMVMATLTPAKEPKFEGMRLPVSQISIELFSPLPGGANLGGRLAPESFKVPHMKGYTPPEAKPDKQPRQP